MEFLEILKYPDPRLRRKAKPLRPEEIPQNTDLVKNLVHTMYKAEGIGLAATQVGIEKRIIVIDVSRRSDERKAVQNINWDDIYSNKELIVAFNPEIISMAGKTSFEEGCLSIPDFNSNVERAVSVKIRALDIHGKEFTVEAEELLAIAFQHEIDHLDGILFIDKVSPLKRSLYNTSLNKKKSAGKDMEPGLVS